MPPTEAPAGGGAGLPAGVAVALLLLAAVLAVELGAVRQLLHLWSTSPMYSYGYMVPAISLYFAYATRDRYLSRPPQPAPIAGGAAFALWAALLVLGRLSGVVLLEQLALVAAVAGIVLVVWGLGWFRVLWFAIAYLLLMVPIWDAFTEPAHLHFQQLSAGIGLRLLDAAGIPAFREGTFITLPNVRLEVARACSGVNYLVAVLALALPLAGLYLRTPWRRIVLVLSGIVIAAVSNGLRVALIGVLAYADVGAPLHGPGHVLHGLFVSGIGMVTLFVVLSFLREPDVPATPAAAPAPAPAPVAEPSRSRLRPAFATLAFVLVFAGGVQAYRPAPVPLRATLETLPLQIGPWVAAPYTLPADPGWWENADAELRRRYLDGVRAIDVFVVYFALQEQSREVAGYRTSALHRAAQAVALSGADGDRRVNAVSGSDAGTVVFWYEVDGRIEADAYTAKARTMWGALTRRQTNAAAVFVRAVPGSDPVPLDALTAFGSELHEALGACLPRRGPAVLAAAATGGEAGTR